MPSITLFDQTTRATAQILPEAGFNCHSLKIPCFGKSVEILDTEPEFGTPASSPTRSGIPLLFPFPNRIREGRFHCQNRDWQLRHSRVDPNGNSIHGYVMNRAWRVTKQTADTLIGEFHLGRDYPEVREDWPADFLIEACYHLADSVLRCDLRIVNTDRVPLPWGFGTHTYFRIPLAPGGCTGDVLIQAPVSDLWELADSLPTGRRLAIPPEVDLREGLTLAGLKLDHVFGGLKSRGGRTETTVMDPAAGLQVTQSFGPEFRELVVFTPPHGRSVCLEPYTCVTDAINLEARGIDAGWRELPPGGQARLWFEITAGPVLA
ncbi:MAG: aldose 1-epimerase [Planctomycetota bacterium]|nr:aldose 1-epimerase [Planctomycetota bacterium]